MITNLLYFVELHMFVYVDTLARLVIMFRRNGDIFIKLTEVGIYYYDYIVLSWSDTTCSIAFERIFCLVSLSKI